MTQRVVITGMAGISPLGCDWESVQQKLHSRTNATQRMSQWGEIEQLHSVVYAPAAPFELPSDRYNRKTTRSMSRVSLMACRCTELALADAGLAQSDWIHNGEMGVAYGSCAGSSDALLEIAQLQSDRSTQSHNATSYVRFMAHTAAVNVSVFHQITGRVITTSSACTSSSQGIGYAYEAVKYGHQRAMIAGGAEEANPAHTAIFDILFATSTGYNQRPELTPRPFDAHRDGLVLGEGAGTLILESLDSALARGAPIYAEIVGFATNCDGKHITNPDSDRMAEVMRLALKDAGLQPDDIGYINAHGTATFQGDQAESLAVEKVFGSQTPVSSLKSYMGHTLGACGVLEAWMTIQMMNNDWYAPTINLTEIDPRCGHLNYIRDQGLHRQCDYVMSNNFAFGGINTSLIFKRWRD